MLEMHATIKHEEQSGSKAEQKHSLGSREPDSKETPIDYLFWLLKSGTLFEIKYAEP